MNLPSISLRLRSRFPVRIFSKIQAVMSPELSFSLNFSQRPMATMVDSLHSRTLDYNNAMLNLLGQVFSTSLVKNLNKKRVGEGKCGFYFDKIEIKQGEALQVR